MAALRWSCRVVLHLSPQDTIPTWYMTCPDSHMTGPPESPSHVPCGNLYAPTVQMCRSVIMKRPLLLHTSLSAVFMANFCRMSVYTIGSTTTSSDFLLNKCGFLTPATCIEHCLVRGLLHRHYKTRTHQIILGYTPARFSLQTHLDLWPRSAPSIYWTYLTLKPTIFGLRLGFTYFFPLKSS